MAEIKSLAQSSFDEIFETHLKAFKDYPFQWSRDALLKTIERRGYDASISFGAFHNNELVSFTLNGLGMFNGIKTAYDTGTGTIEEHRGKGLASKIFEHSIPCLKTRGIEQYVLEVLEENEKAFSVYQKQGFQVSRKMDCFRVEMAQWNIPKIVKEFELREIDFSFQKEMETMIDFPLSWQNSFESLQRQPDNFVVLGIFDKDVLIGYGIIELLTGDIPQMAVSKEHRRKGIGRFLLSELKKRNCAPTMKIINIDFQQKGIQQFITDSGVPYIVSQFEMIKVI